NGKTGNRLIANSDQFTANANNIRSIWNMLDDPGFVKFSAGIMFVSLPKAGRRKITIRVPKAVTIAAPTTETPQRQDAMIDLDADDEPDTEQEQEALTAAASTSASAPTADEDHDLITARFLSSHPLPCWNETTPEADRALIIHFHGGGFIAMSSYSHQDYSRRWAKQTGLPILSIDYRLAPAFPYPTPMNDCYAAYKWAVEHAHTHLGAQPSRFIVTGDSAGGACTASVALQAIANNYRIPDGLLLSYPALNLYRYAMLPSRLLAFKDCILPFAFLDMVIRVYIPEALVLRAKEEPFLSPAHAPDDWLSRFPPTYIGVGDEDPLYHDSIQFAHRLHRLRRTVSLSVYRGFPHGYLSFSALIKQATKIITETGHLLENLARGRIHTEMMFAPEPTTPQQAPSVADDYELLYCRELNYSRPHRNLFKKSPVLACTFEAHVSVKCSDTLHLWRKRYGEIRSGVLLLWSDESKKADFAGAYMLRRATLHHDASAPKYLTVNAHAPDARSMGTEEIALTLWTDDAPSTHAWHMALSRATDIPPYSFPSTAQHSSSSVSPE
ncbi:MAG: alpha/beta hydrolase, partial [Phycisphaerales bacterium]|nr:alpha/beta hydrolase [Phycisphaerales bacterium]